MPTHWTYAKFEPQDDLEQGDILEPTDEVRAILRQVHPHFVDPKYTAFLVLTQTCDLVRRKDGECRSRYISIGVVRPIAAVLTVLLDKVCNVVVPGVYTHESKDKAKQLLERVVNQNEQALGLFYLHPDADAGIGEPSVALLQVSIAVRAGEHYDRLRESRRGRLAESFQPKLGWLTGNLFSRVATRDWEHRPRERLIEELLAAGGREEPKWIPQSWVENAVAAGIRVGDLPRERLPEVLEAHKPKSPREQILDVVVDTVRQVDVELSPENLRSIEHRLRNNPLFNAALRQARRG